MQNSSKVKNKSLIEKLLEYNNLKSDVGYRNIYAISYFIKKIEVILNFYFYFTIIFT